MNAHSLVRAARRALLLAAVIAGVLIAPASAAQPIIHFAYTYYARVIHHGGRSMVLLTSLEVNHERGVKIYVGCGTAAPRHLCARGANPISVRRTKTSTAFRGLNYLLAVGSTFDIQALAPGHIGRFAVLEAENVHHRFALALARHGCLSRLGVPVSCSATATPAPTGGTGPSGTTTPPGSTPAPGGSNTPLPPPTPVFTLSLGISGSGTLTATGVSCTTSCSDTYPEGTVVTITATPAAGNTFAGWSGACSGTGPCTITISADTSLNATFSPYPTVATTITGQGTVAIAGTSCTSSCAQAYAPGTAVTLSATAATGYTFTGWGGACSGTAACHLTVNSTVTVKATFVADATLTTTVTGAGTVSGSGVSCTATCTKSYAPGTVVTLSATPVTGHQFAGWGGACSGTGACSFTISAATSVTASFTVLTETLTVTQTGPSQGTVSGGGISCGATCSVTVAYGTTITLTASAPWDVAFAGWSGADCSGSGTCVIDLTADATVGAAFTGFVETPASDVTSVWTDFTTAAGTMGQAIPGGQAVQVTCWVTGLAALDGNTYWYRIASSPWGGAYYAPADAFYNSAGTGGSPGTPPVDPAVPAC